MPYPKEQEKSAFDERYALAMESLDGGLHESIFAPKTREDTLNDEKTVYTRRAKDKDSLRKAIRKAVSTGEIAEVEKLIHYGADVNLPDSSGKYALNMAMYEQSIEIIDLLFRSGADVDIQDIYGVSPMMICAANMSYFKFAHIFNYHPVKNINEQDNNGYTALMFAVHEDAIEIVEWLLHKGADPNIKTNNGETTLMKAKHNDNIDMQNILKKYGAIEI
jgi:ankyrin repeat protein